MSAISEKLELFRWSAHYEGWPFALFRIAVRSTAALGTSGTSIPWFHRLSAQRFDSRFQVDTGGSCRPEDAGIPEERQADATDFFATSPPQFGSFLSKLEIDFQEYTFIDFGSGKGRTLLMASDFPFKKVVGIELSKDLHEIARRNIDTYSGRQQQCHDLQSVCDDATEFEFPNDPLVLFFFNPFSGRILGEVLRNLAASLTSQPRHVIAIYHNPIHASEFHANPVFASGAQQLTTAPDWVVFESTVEDQHACEPQCV